jgi:hypothetical protein
MHLDEIQMRWICMCKGREGARWICLRPACRVRHSCRIRPCLGRIRPPVCHRHRIRLHRCQIRPSHVSAKLEGEGCIARRAPPHVPPSSDPPMLGPQSQNSQNDWVMKRGSRNVKRSLRNDFSLSGQNRTTFPEHGTWHRTTFLVTVVGARSGLPVYWLSSRERDAPPASLCADRARGRGMHLRPLWGEMMRRGRCTRPTPAMGEREEPSPGLPWEGGRGEEFLVTAPPYGKNLNNDTCNTSGEILQWYYVHL